MRCSQSPRSKEPSALREKGIRSSVNSWPAAARTRRGTSARPRMSCGRRTQQRESESESEQIFAAFAPPRCPFAASLSACLTYEVGDLVSLHGAKNRGAQHTCVRVESEKIWAQWQRPQSRLVVLCCCSALLPCSVPVCPLTAAISVFCVRLFVLLLLFA